MQMIGQLDTVIMTYRRGSGRNFRSFGPLNPLTEGPSVVSEPIGNFGTVLAKVNQLPQHNRNLFLIDCAGSKPAVFFYRNAFKGHSLTDGLEKDFAFMRPREGRLENIRYISPRCVYANLDSRPKLSGFTIKRKCQWGVRVRQETSSTIIGSGGRVPYTI